MGNEIRKSGIDVIGDVTWGTHFCQFYQTKQDLIDTLVPYFKTGLENDEFCMWVTADNLTAAEVRKAMSKAMPGFSRYLKKGQIEILPYDEWYLKEGIFNSQSVLDGWVEKLNQALAKGYSGLRLTGNTFWLEKEHWQSFTDYEEAVNNVIGKYNMIALCTYYLDKCNAAEIVDVIRNHEFALIKQEGKWELFENSRYKATKEALAESENLMHAFFDSPGMMRGIVEIVDDNTVRHIRDNSVTAGFMGLKPEALRNKLSSELGEPPDVIRIWVNHYRQSMKTGKPVNFEYLDLRGENEAWLSATVSFMGNSVDGQPQFSYVVSDITKRKQELEAQQHLLERLEIAYEAAGAGAWDWNVISGHIEWTPKMFELLALDPQKTNASFETWENILHPEDREKASEQINKALREHTQLYNEYRIILPDKQIRWISAMGKGIYDMDGKPVRMIGICTDITIRKKAEEEILHLASFPELNPNPIIELDGNRQIIYMNSAIKKLLPDISNQGIKHPFMIDWETLTQKLRSEDTSLINREIKVGESWYAQTVTYVRNSNSYRIYGRDITARKKSEENTLREKTFSETTINSLPGVFYLFKKNGKFLRWNRNFEMVTGYSSQEFLGLTPLDLFDPEEKDRIAEAIHRVFVEGKDDVEANLISKNGKKTQYYFTGVRMIDNGESYLIGSGIDISEREQAEQLLRETGNYLNNLIDYANAPIIVWDPQFRISRFNPAFERLTGYKSNDVIGLQLDMLFPADKKAECLQQIRRTLSGERWEVVEIPILRVDGMIRIVLWNSANVYDNDGKEIIATIAQGQDITERKQAQEKLQETSNYLNNLLDYANAPIIVWDPQFRITRFNQAFEKLTGISTSEAIGKPLEILFPEGSKANSMNNIRKTMSGERWEAVEIPIQDKDSKVHVVLWNSATLFGVDGKNMVATIAQGQDITERKLAEEEVKKLNEKLNRRATELESSNKELEAFAYSVSHDLRAPLRSMEGFSQALLEDFSPILNDEGKDYLRRIQGSAELMAQLIDDMLQLSRLTRVDMQVNDVNLSELAQEIAVDLKRTETDRKVKFVITPGLIVQGDEKLLRIMLDNLLGNAWKFTGKTTGARIEFGVTEHEGKKAYYVRDNGAGFDMQYVGKLFNPFQRLHTINEFPGTGVGLASVQRIIRRHGGQVWAEGKVGEGATFYFTLE